MNTDEEIIKESIAYLNQNKKEFLENYTKNIELSDNKVAIFTAGMSGVGKIELATFLKEENSKLLHIDTDDIREFFRPIGYDGQNSNLYQKVATRGFSELFSHSLKKGYSLIMDSNFANMDVAVLNIKRLLKKFYRVEVLYLYDYPELCYEYATRREVVTHRKVPKDVFVRSNINSYKTVLEIKKLFQEEVELTFFDKRNADVYNNIEIDLLKSLIGESFDI
ncbi:MAG: Unknown protein [uncultured Sulfurovum sp.]|uniref:Zeta toxin domain-containing protein n=1 Tax=uncultured Sulfurovum sp. TaxID=269237 RepID=A0A6S6SX04_9BACT|nr:MAG: Unknown protein [uncultured Sulfurovum sp.]